MKNYYKPGVLSSEYSLKNNKIDGLYKSYYKSGKLNVKCYFKNGVINGLYKQCSEKELIYISYDINNIIYYLKFSGKNFSLII